MSASRVGDWLGGIGTATWLFLPIAASAGDARMIMMWEPRHTAGLFIAWLGVAAAGAGALRVARSTAPRWLRFAALAIALAPSALSGFNFTVRHLAAAPGELPINGWLALTLVACLAAFVFLLVRRRVPGSSSTRAREFLTLSSALVVPFWIGVARLSGPGRIHSGALLGDQGRRSPASGCGDVDVILLDELSYGAVFSDGAPSRNSLTALAASARIYHAAMSPATTTLASVSSYLTGWPAGRISVNQNTPFFIRDDSSLGPIAEALSHRGLFYNAKRLGYRTEVVGWYFPYCEALGATADSCRTVAMYNAATLDDGISPLAPFVTIANMWPYEWPTGLFKRPAAVWLHQAELDLLRREAMAPTGEGPVFRWVHFNVPHRPWLEGNGLADVHAFDADPRRYERQLGQVDEAVTSFLDGLRAAGRYDNATIVVTSDHGARNRLRGDGDDPQWVVPLIIKPPGGGRRQAVWASIEVQNVLQDVVSRACGMDR